MIYYIGFHEEEASWTTEFNQAVISELERREIEHRVLPPCDWATGAIDEESYHRVDSSNNDTWLFAWSQSAAIDAVAGKPGTRLAFVIGMFSSRLGPGQLPGNRRGQRERLARLDGLLCASQWCRNSLVGSYPELARRCHVVGAPVDHSGFDNYREVPKDPRLVVFNQRFALEKLHFIEIEVGRRLVSRGYAVWHMSAWKQEYLVQFSPGMALLLRYLSEAGIQWVYSSTREQYHQRLAGAGVVVTTPVTTVVPNSVLEGICMGVVPVAPRSLCFEEFIHPDNLYTPYDIDEIVARVEARPLREHAIDRFRKDAVMDRVLALTGPSNPDA